MDESLTPVLADIEHLAQTTLAEQSLPGLAVGLVRDDELAWFAGFGRADLDRDAAPTVNSLARVASVTKTFTATAILQLRDAGHLSLDDPLVEHIPEFASAQVADGTLEGVTLRRLLTHRSGLVTESPVDGWSALRFPTRDEILAALPQTEIVIPADSAWKYSNLGYGLLGEVIGRISGVPYEQYVQENLLDPLGMTGATFDLDDESRSMLMTGHNPARYQARPEPAAYAHLQGISAAGQLQASVADLARWVSFQFRGDGGARAGAQVLDGRSLNEMHRPQYIEDDWSAGQCLGWRATRIGDHVYHNHGGGIHGFSTQVWFHRPSRTGAIVLLNSWPPPGGFDLVQQILERVLAEEAATDAAPIDMSPVPPSYAGLLGSYLADPGQWVDIVWRDGALRLEVTSGQASALHAPAQLQPTDAEGVFRVQGGRAAGERVQFVSGEGGPRYRLGAFEFRRVLAVRDV